MHQSRAQTEIDLRLFWACPNGMGGLSVQNGLCATGSLVPKLVTNAEVIVFCVVVLNLGETDEPPASARHG